MDAQSWIYVVIGVIYLLSRLLKKEEQSAGEPVDTQPTERRGPRQTGQPSAETPRPLTFEELLREITSGKEAAQPEPEPELIPPTYERTEKRPAKEARNFEEVSLDEAERVRKWKPYAEIPLQPERRSLEETLRLQDTVMDFGKFAAFQQKNQLKLSDTYIKIIRNPETLKQAVVMSEILKTKF